jgi:hypothetical protein
MRNAGLYFVRKASRMVVVLGIYYSTPEDATKALGDLKRQGTAAEITYAEPQIPIPPLPDEVMTCSEVLEIHPTAEEAAEDLLS